MSARSSLAADPADSATVLAAPDADPTAVNAGLPIVGPDDPPVWLKHNPRGRARAVVLADHARNRVPAALDRLGLPHAPLERHIAYDIGVEWMTRRLAERLDAPALLHGYSRLIIDPNRPLDDPTSICAISDGVVVPGNRDVAPEAAAERAAAFHRPYHTAVDAEIRRIEALGTVPAVISMHSFTAALRGAERPWHVGILWAEDGRIPKPLMTALAADGSICVGDNEPYSGRNLHGYTMETHALPRGLPNVLIEVRQDLIATEAEAVAWADRLADALAPILDDDGLYRRFA
jgi:predicted N-formylglutamate amidohydrolase